MRSGPSTVTLPPGVTGEPSFPKVMFTSTGLPGIGVQLKTNMSPILTNASGGGAPSVGGSGGEGCCLHITTLHFSVSNVHTSMSPAQPTDCTHRSRLL